MDIYHVLDPQFIFPFMNTLVNLGKRGLEMTPGVGLMAEMSYRRFDPQFNRDSFGHRPSDIIAKQIEGMALAAMIFLLLDNEELVGAMPQDPQTK